MPNVVDGWVAAEATEIGEQTCVGGLVEKTYPHTRGNCFSVIAENRSWRILNFYVENMGKLLEDQVVRWPVSVLLIPDSKCAVIHDVRIPHGWYREDFCESCCPPALLPATQRMGQLRRILAGVRTEHPNGMVSEQIICDRRELSNTFSFEMYEVVGRTIINTKALDKVNTE